MATKNLAVNGTDYRWPDNPVAVVCIDGGDPAYIKHGLSAGIIPNIARYMEEGFHTLAHGTMPSFTCPNNMSIVTGCPPSVHGISGNYYLDRELHEWVPGPLSLVVTTADGVQELRAQALPVRVLDRVSAEAVLVTVAPTPKRLQPSPSQ